MTDGIKSKFTDHVKKEVEKYNQLDATMTNLATELSSLYMPPSIKRDLRIKLFQLRDEIGRQGNCLFSLHTED